MANKKDPELELQRKTQIMLVTFKLLALKSHEKMTLADVARDTQMSPGLVSYYFKNKENLILETAHFILNIRKEGLLALTRLKTSPQNRIKKLIELALPSSEEVNLIANFCIQLWVYSKKSPEMAKIFTNLIKEQQNFVEEVVGQMGEEGYFKKGSIKEKALLINAVLDGLGIHMTLKPEWDIKKVHKIFYAVINKVVREDI